METPDLIELLAEIEETARRGLRTIEQGKTDGLPTNGSTALNRIAARARDAADAARENGALPSSRPR